jgi:hypothetical protein
MRLGFPQSVVQLTIRAFSDLCTEFPCSYDPVLFSCVSAIFPDPVRLAFREATQAVLVLLCLMEVLRAGTLIYACLVRRLPTGWSRFVSRSPLVPLLFITKTPFLQVH